MGSCSTASALSIVVLILTPCSQLVAAATQADDAVLLLELRTAAGFATASGWSGQQPCATGAEGVILSKKHGKLCFDQLPLSGSAHLSSVHAALCCAVQALSGQTSHAARMPIWSSVCVVCCCLAWGLLVSFLH
jgi:hypothetical protein